MVIDNDLPIRGSAKGRFEGLDLMTPLYLGGAPKDVDISDTGFSNGFKGKSHLLDSIHNAILNLNRFEPPSLGCISRFVVGGKEQIISPSLREKTSEGVESCEPCSKNPCENGGFCQSASSPSGLRCICLPGFSGEFCKKEGETCYEGTLSFISCLPGLPPHCRRSRQPKNVPAFSWR